MLIKTIHNIWNLLVELGEYRYQTVKKRGYMMY